MPLPKRTVDCPDCLLKVTHFAKGRCERCYRVWSGAIYKRKHRETIRAQSKEYSERTRPARRKSGRDHYWRYHERNKEKAMERHYRKEYALTLKERDDLLKAQGGACAICRTLILKFGRGRDQGNVDHCHKTGTVRGVLCSTCNKGLGFFELRSEAAASYLRGETPSAPTPK